MNMRSLIDRLAASSRAVATWCRRFGRDEYGTTMTEFIVILPVFILVFAGIANLARLNRAAIRVGAVAYSDMWQKAKEVQTGDPGPHASTAGGGQAVTTGMSTYEGLQEKPGMAQIVRHETNAMGQGLISNGSMGESHARVSRARDNVTFRHIDGDVTAQLSGVTGESEYATLLFDDSSGAPTYHSQSGGAGMGGPSVRPVAAAGLRYGSVIGEGRQSVDVAGRTFDFNYYFATLVAPTWRREDTAAEITHSTLDGLDAYDNMLGIATNQPLQRDAIDVPVIEGAL